MKDTQPTSIKSSTQASHPYPGTPHPNLSTPHAGPRFFPQNVLQDDEDMGADTSPHVISPPSPHLQVPSSLATPTPYARVSPGQLLPDDLLLTLEICLKEGSPHSGLSRAPDSGLAESIHAPSVEGGDQIMSTSAPAHSLSAEEQNILAHLALTRKNRAAVQNDGPHHITSLPQFMPTPLGGFPLTHLSHSTQVFDHLDNKVLLAWFQVAQPVRVSPLQPQGVMDSDRVRQQRQSITPIKAVLDQDRLKRSFVGLKDSRRIRSSRLP
ncbi:hypothetical protein BD769DRAFT_1683357 [Suillus cothurnatus]|nr:hypothetical protein BD769DRAFT_1683357 [Suillus cothurnatus]